MKLIQLGSTAAKDDLEFLMVDSADHVTGKTGLTVTVTLRKPGGSFASPSGAVSEIASGWYRVAANATDNGTAGALLLHATASGADPTDDRYQVVGFDPSDSVRIGLTALPNAAAGANGGLPTGNASGQVAVASLANNAITASAIASDAITDAKVASDVTIASVTGAVGSVTGNVGGNVTGSVGSVSGMTASDVAAIKAKTDNLPSDPADQSLIIAATDALASLITTVDTVVDGIKSKTDSLTFTVSGKIDANIHYVNGVLVTGDGSGTPWGP